MKCYNCGHELNEGAKYCPICGSPIMKMDDTDWEKVEIPELKAPVVAGEINYSRQEIAEFLEKEPEKKPKKNPFLFIEKIKETLKIIRNPENKKEVKLTTIVLIVLFVFMGCFFIIPNFWSIYYSFKSPVVSEFIDNDSEEVMLAQNNGILYNNRGVVNDEFKNNLSNMLFIPAGHIGVVIDNDNNLYFINCEDLTTEYIDHAIGYACSYYGGTLYYIDDDMKLKVNDLLNRTTMTHKSVNQVTYAAMSPNSGYICTEEAWYDVYNGDQKYKICVFDKEDNPIYEYDLGYDYYEILSMSNDGKTVYLRPLYDGDKYYCLHDGKFDEIYSANEPDYTEIYLNVDENKMLINDHNKIYCHTAGDNGCELIYSASGVKTEIYPKANMDIDSYAHFILEDSFDGIVICDEGFSGGPYYWLDKDMNTVPFAENEIEETVGTVAKDKDDYKFLYTNEGDIHYATWIDGKAGDVILKEGDDPIYEIVSDDEANNIWLSTEGKDIYHVSGDAIERIYSYEGGPDVCPSLAYDTLTDFLYYTTPDHKLIGVDKNDEVKMEIKGVAGFVEGTEDSGDIIFEFKGGGEYRIIFDKLVKYESD
ncbi:MAG: zinc ribbon domain-containing protein [Butyrivibrio sp.]|nr:zinc ribbon domain-containing protein [Butyrivibrio sp.]